MNLLFSVLFLIGLLCFIFLSAIIIGLLCFAIFNYNKLQDIYQRRKPKDLLDSDRDTIKGVFLYSVLVVVVVIIYILLLFFLNIKEINLSFFYITILTVMLCMFLIDLNVSLITDAKIYNRIYKIQMVFNVLLVLVFAIGTYISNNNRDSYNKNNI